MIAPKDFWVWFGGIWFGVGVLFLAIGIAVGVVRTRLDARLDAGGVPASGVVLTKDLPSSRDRASEYRVTFRFDADGESVRGSAKLDADAWDALTERGPIAVTYLPGSPDTYRVPGETGDDTVVSVVFSLVGAALAVAGGVLLGYALRRRKLEARLAADGAAAAAEIVNATPSGLRINGVAQWHLLYRYRDGNGREHDGRVLVSPEQAERWPAGRRGHVRYDRADPRRHVWVGE
jgi:hypothetical protein